MIMHEMLLSPTQLQIIEEEVARQNDPRNVTILQLLSHQKALGMMCANLNQQITVHLDQVAVHQKYIEQLSEIIGQLQKIEHAAEKAPETTEETVDKIIEEANSTPEVGENEFRLS